MMNEKEKTPPTKLLHYRKGDLIVKQGDYGISIYKIIKGKVRIFRESGEKEIDLDTLGPGGVIGEMNFLDRALEARFASAKALEDSEVEVLHPATLANEYEKMPHIIKYIANQTLKRLIHMNNIIAQLLVKREEYDKALQDESTAARRYYYRKEVVLNCTYRPVDSSPKVPLEGLIKNISLSGMGLDVRVKNAQKFSHKPGVTLFIETTLPNGKRIAFTAKIISVFEDRTPGKLFLGMTFVELTDEARKRLGFFLMPT
jgi:CRP-like cAMP-binding protein